MGRRAVSIDSRHGLPARGTSGSRLVLDDGRALAAVSTGSINPKVAHTLPAGWLHDIAPDLAEGER